MWLNSHKSFQHKPPATVSGEIHPPTQRRVVSTFNVRWMNFVNCNPSSGIILEIGIRWEKFNSRSSSFRSQNIRTWRKEAPEEIKRERKKDRRSEYKKPTLLTATGCSSQDNIIIKLELVIITPPRRDDGTESKEEVAKL